MIGYNVLKRSAQVHLKTHPRHIRPFSFDYTACTVFKQILSVLCEWPQPPFSIATVKVNAVTTAVKLIIFIST